MRTAMRPRYYCDYCKKGSGSPSAMIRHERSCTANPDRVCNMCALLGLEHSPGSNKIIAAKLLADGADYQEVMRELRANADGCPACILAALRLSGATVLGGEENGPWRWDGHLFGFAFKREMDDAIKEHNFHSGGEA